MITWGGDEHNAGSVSLTFSHHLTRPMGQDQDILCDSKIVICLHET